MEKGQIPYFRAKELLGKSDQTFTCFALTGENSLVVGTQSGSLCFYSLERGNATLINSHSLFRNSVTRIDVLAGGESLLVCSDSTLYFVRNGKKVEILRGISGYDVRPAESIFFAGVKDRVLKYSIEKMIKANDAKGGELLKEITLGGPVKSVVCLSSEFSLAVEMVTRDWVFFDLREKTSFDSSLPKKEDAVLGLLSTGEVLAVVKLEKRLQAGIFMDSRGATSSQRNSLNFSAEQRIAQILSNSQFFLLSTGGGALVFTLRESRQVQNLVGSEPFLAFSFAGEELFAISKGKIFGFEKMDLDQLTREARVNPNVALSVELLRSTARTSDPERVEQEVAQLYLTHGFLSLDANKIEEAFLCLSQIPFDPIELISAVGQNFLLGTRTARLQAVPNQKKALLKRLLLKKREEILAIGDNHRIPTNQVLRLHPENATEVNARDWLAQIDYALLRSMAELADQTSLRELFDFLRKSGRIYFDGDKDAVNELAILVQELGKSSEFAPGILAELSAALRAPREALRWLREAQKTAKRRPEAGAFAHNRAVDFLVKFQKNEEFLELLNENFEWLIEDKFALTELVRKVEDKHALARKLLVLGEKFPSDGSDFPVKEALLDALVSAQKDNQDSNDQFVIYHLRRSEGDDKPGPLARVLELVKDPQRKLDSEKLLKVAKGLKGFPKDRAGLVGEKSLLLLDIAVSLMANCGTQERQKEALLALLAVGETNRAEDFCSDASLHRRTDPRFLFHSLLEAYIAQFRDAEDKVSRDSHLKKIGDFLKKFAGNENFDPAKVLDLLPKELMLNNPEVDVFGFLDSTLIEYNAKERRVFFEKSLSEAYLNCLSAEFAAHRRRFVKVDDSSTACVACKKRIQQKNFEVFPNGTIVDSACFNAIKRDKPTEDKCPLTGQNFAKTNFL